jgi:aerobic-type carbon monoxide dehydrogenase small subunit (CoxS/CutS family)
VLISTTVNGSDVNVDVEPNTLLIDFLRDALGLTGVKRSCEIQVCGACTVIVDGRPVSSCCALAADISGCSVLTIEGLGSDDQLDPVQQAFLDHSAFQCGFCTPGFILAVAAMRSYLVDTDTIATRLRDELSGSICRCTGYNPIVAAARCALLGVCELHQGVGDAES